MKVLIVPKWYPWPDRPGGRVPEAAVDVRVAERLFDEAGVQEQSGVGPRDLISILQSIKAAGAMQADLEIL